MEGNKPGGGFFLVDPNQSGGAANLALAEVLWGRLVDVHQIDANGERVDPPVFTDFVIDPALLTDVTRYVLDRNPVTQRERLTIQNIHGPDPQDSSPEEDKFLTLLKTASESLPFVAEKNDDGSSSPPFTTVARNACMVLRFGDCLDDDASAAQNLINTVEVFSGYPPTTPFSARVVFDPNHGAVVNGSFHTTRVLVDMTISEAEGAALPTVQDVNSVGLPASRTTSSSANVSVRIASQVDLGSGQSQILTNLSGVPVDVDDNGPVDFDSPSVDVVRAVKAGNPEDPPDSNGFLRDREKPRVVGGWPITVTNAADDGAGDLGFDFLISLTFNTSCLVAPSVGDVVTVGENFAQVTQAAALSGNSVVNLKVRTVSEQVDSQTLVGDGLYQAPFLPSLPLASGCWVSFLPEALTFPTAGVETLAQVLVRFSEPMDPDTLSPFGGFMVVRGAAAAVSTAISSNIVVGEVLQASRDLTSFSYLPSSPYPHTLNTPDDTFHIELSQARDLAGNSLRHQIPFVDFTIAAQEATESNSALVLRFETNDEYEPDGADADPFADAPDPNDPSPNLDIRGQFFYDDGLVLPRPVAFSGWPVDRNNPVPMRMAPFAGGVFTPLNPLGCKLQMLWRYCDLGWNVRDETKYNLDVIGLNWSPFGGQVTADFYDQFEMRLGHSRFLPDEGATATIPLSASSGLPTTAFEDNYLAGSNPRVVHNRALGYSVSPATLFTATSGTAMLPYPLNEGQGADVTYTWRDTSILSLGADGDPNQRGIPLGVEVAAGLVPAAQAGDLGRAMRVPSYGLPLLVEVRCHPSDLGLGFNVFGIAVAGTGAAPAFRAFTTGGTDSQGNPQIVLPDAEIFPRGVVGAAPGTSPVIDAAFYLGQLDTVVRVSRIHTVWLDAGDSVFPLWRTPVVEPSLTTLPTGTQLLIDYRSATGFSQTGDPPFEAAKINAYGNQINTSDPQPQSLTEWSSDISIGNNARYLQVRLTFINNIETGVGPVLDSLALPYELQ